MHKLKERNVALVFSFALGGWHLLWSVLVALGVAQSILDFIFRLHMIQPVYKVAQFNFGTALALIVVTAIIGYAMGWAIAWIWNRVHRG